MPGSQTFLPSTLGREILDSIRFAPTAEDPPDSQIVAVLGL